MTITLVAVTKYVSADAVRPLVAAGCHDLGESRPQQLWEKAAALADLPIRWHMIGHLQRNKVRRTLPLVAMIHSVDSPRLLAAIEEEAAIGDRACHRQSSPLPLGEGQGEGLRRLPVLLEVNMSGEAAKHGFAPERSSRFLAELVELPARCGSRADVHGRLGGRAGRRPPRFRRAARAARPSLRSTVRPAIRSTSSRWA